MKLNLIFIIFVLTFISLNKILAQSFSLVTDSNNPIVTAVPPSGYTGISWIDYNGDSNLDLFINNNQLFMNTGNGFTQISTSIGSGQNLATGNGNSWADYDNDGDLDVYISGSTSFLYRNEGNNSFTKILSGTIGNGFANRGWSCAWGDFDNDGFVDLVITHPAGFVTSSSTTNHLLRNSGGGVFTKVTTGDVVTGFAPYTVASWADFDGDGDLDLSIGSGPANGNPDSDYFYKNNLKESGTANLTRIKTGGPAKDARDGQVWNWIDYDNDGDLDVYITNWRGASGGLKNDFYRNDNGVFTKITSGNIASDGGTSLASVWSDFDNDGHIDCYVGNEDGWPDRLYMNNGDGTFSSITGSPVNSTATKHSASAGDYDNDGRVDLVTLGPSSISLFHNETINDNNWAAFKLEGTASNRAAIGAKIRVKAVIESQAIWQMREISAQNSFNSQNDLRAHFGLGNAAVIDSIKVEWPSGIVDIETAISVNSYYKFVEGEGIKSTTGIKEVETSIPSEISLEQNYPNPFNPSTVIRFSIPFHDNVSLKIYDVLGNEIKSLLNRQLSAGTYEFNFNSGLLSSGVYFYKLAAGNNVMIKKMILMR